MADDTVAAVRDAVLGGDEASVRALLSAADVSDEVVDAAVKSVACDAPDGAVGEEALVRRGRAALAVALAALPAATEAVVKVKSRSFSFLDPATDVLPVPLFRVLEAVVETWPRSAVCGLLDAFNPFGETYTVTASLRTAPSAAKLVLRYEPAQPGRRLHLSILQPPPDAVGVSYPVAAVGMEAYAAAPAKIGKPYGKSSPLFSLAAWLTLEMEVDMDARPDIAPRDHRPEFHATFAQLGWEVAEPRGS